MDTASLITISSCLRIPQNIRRGVLLHNSRVQPLSFYPSSTCNELPSFRAMAVEKERSSQSPAVPNSVPVGVAYELIQAGHRYLDVRTNEEFDSGHVVGAVNVPFMLRTGSDMARNPKFLEQVLDQFGKDDEIVVGCQIGKRSLMASSELTSSGFTAITDMGGGYAAWVQNGLPTTMSQ